MKRAATEYLNGCMGKLKFLTAAQAYKAAISTDCAGTLLGLLKPYLCRNCDHYHNGHPQQKYQPMQKQARKIVRRRYDRVQKTA